MFIVNRCDCDPFRFCIYPFCWQSVYMMLPLQPVTPTAWPCSTHNSWWCVLFYTHSQLCIQCVVCGWICLYLLKLLPVILYVWLFGLGILPSWIFYLFDAYILDTYGHRMCHHTHTHTLSCTGCIYSHVYMWFQAVYSTTCCLMQYSYLFALFYFGSTSHSWILIIDNTLKSIDSFTVFITF